MWLPYISQSSIRHSSKWEKAKSEPLKVLPVNLHFVKIAPSKLNLSRFNAVRSASFIGDLRFTRRSTSFLLISAISSFNVDRL